MPDHEVEYVDLPIYHDQLASALSFTQSDLEENRAGRLSSSQRGTQFRVIARSVAKSVVFALLALACVSGAIAIGVTTGLGVRVLLLAGVFLAFVVIFAYYMFPLWRDMDAGRVSSIEGLVRPAERETRISAGHGPGFQLFSFYWIVDDSQRFWVTGKAYGALTPARHRLYFLPLSRRIVAAEPISGPVK